VEERKNGRTEEWKNGRMEEWKGGRVEGWKGGSSGAKTDFGEDGFLDGLRAVPFVNAGYTPCSAGSRPDFTARWRA